jgi:hypothetical protein
MNHRPSSPAARISLSAGGSGFNWVSFTRFQYGLSATVGPGFPTRRHAFTASLHSAGQSFEHEEVTCHVT